MNAIDEELGLGSEGLTVLLGVDPKGQKTETNMTFIEDLCLK